MQKNNEQPLSRKSTQNPFLAAGKTQHLHLEQQINTTNTNTTKTQIKHKKTTNTNATKTTKTTFHKEVNSKFPSVKLNIYEKHV